MASSLRSGLFALASCAFATAGFHSLAASPDLPVFSQQPGDQAVGEGSALTFSPVVFSPSPMSHQWLHNGVALMNETNISLTITNASRSDTGWYVVRTANDAGMATSRAAFLTVNGSPAGTIQFNNASGERVQSINGGNATGTSIQLFAGPTPDRIRPTGVYAVVNNGLFVGGTISLPFVAPGQIVYVMTELADGQQSNVIPVSSGTGFAGGTLEDLRHPTFPEWPTPGILEQPASTEVGLGDSVSLAVTVLDYSTVTVKWIKDGNPVPVFEQVLPLGPLTSIEGTSIFTIPAAQLSDAGSYKAVLVSDFVDSIRVSDPVSVGVVIPGNGEITSIEEFNGVIRIEARGRPNRLYTLEFNSQGGGWNSLFSVASPDGGIRYPGFNPPSSNTWFRLRSSD